MTEELITIGTIVSPHGLKGEVKVYTDSDFLERFETPGKRWLKRPDTEHKELVTLTRGYPLPGKNFYVVTFKEVTTRNEAEALRKSQLFVNKDDRPLLEENEFHVADLIDLAVIDQTTENQIGHVVDLYTAGNDLLVVALEPPFVEQYFADKPKAKTQVLIPFVEEIVPIVDLTNGRLVVNLPPGLLEL